MSKKIFITGTDTNVGKTFISTVLLQGFSSFGLKTLGLKPVASGHKEHTIPYNEDALSLQQASSVKLAYENINPFCFKEAIAPHIAAKKSATALDLKILNKKIHQGLTTPSDICIIEGAGGWHLPLNEKETMADFVSHHRFNTILIVSIQLGCINHAILTQHAMLSTNIPIIGWIANCKTPFIDHGEEQIQALKQWLSIPYLGTVHHQAEKISNDILLRVNHFLNGKAD